MLSEIDHRFRVEATFTLPASIRCSYDLIKKGQQCMVEAEEKEEEGEKEKEEEERTKEEKEEPGRVPTRKPHIII